MLKPEGRRPLGAWQGLSESVNEVPLYGTCGKLPLHRLTCALALEHVGLNELV